MQNVDGVVQNVWAFENRQISLLPTSAILVRIIIGKVADEARLRKAFDKTPIRAGSQGYEDWNCVSWAEEALACAAHDGKVLGNCRTDWAHVRDRLVLQGPWNFKGCVLCFFETELRA